MTKSEHAILHKLERHGSLSRYQIDRWFVAQRHPGFAAEILSTLSDRGLVSKTDDGLYVITREGEQALKDAA